jgi:hypothetical protein
MPGQFPQISPTTVREIAQARPVAGDFREQFPQRQPQMAAFLEEQLGEEKEVAVEFGGRLAAALWTIYERTAQQPLPPVSSELLERFLPAARGLLDRVGTSRGDEPFDPEWLAELPRGNQPHVMGFVIGALRAARLRIDGADIKETAIILLAMAGALETTAAALLPSDQN